MVPAATAARQDPPRPAPCAAWHTDPGRSGMVVELDQLTLDTFGPLVPAAHFLYGPCSPGWGELAREPAPGRSRPARISAFFARP